MSIQNSWLNLMKPNKPEFKSVMDEGGRKIATVVMEPLEHGVGLALGYALKQVLVTSLPGAAVTAVRIEGVLDESSAIFGVCENVTEIISNIQEIELRMEMEGPSRLMIRKKGPGPVFTKDIQSADNVEILNPGHVICTLDRGSEIRMELTANVGKGYEPAECNRQEDAPTGFMSLDSHYSPVKKVFYKVENASEGGLDYDKLTMTVETDGSLTAEDAFVHSVRILQNQMSVLVDLEEPQMEGVDATLSEIDFNHALSMEIRQLGLSTRASNCLIIGDVDRVRDLIQKSEPELLRMPNFGKKSLKEVKEVLARMGLQLGMDVESGTPENNEFDPRLLKKIQQLGLSTRVANTLLNESFIYVGEIVQKTEAEMLRLPDFGRQSLNEVEESLAQMGLHLGMEVEFWAPGSIDFKPVVLTKVRELGLSVRAYNCLYNERCGYVWDLIKMSEPELLRSPNFGRKSMKEVKEVLAQMGLHLGIEVESCTPESIYFNPVFLKKVNELELSVRVCNCLHNEGIVYVGDLIQRSAAEMLRKANMGRKSLKEIKEVLDGLGLQLGMKMKSWPPENIDELAKRYEECCTERAENSDAAQA